LVSGFGSDNVCGLDRERTLHLHEAVRNDTVPQHSTGCVGGGAFGGQQSHDARGTFEMGLPALSIPLVEINEVEFDEKVHRGQCNLGACGVERIEHLAQVAHGLLFSRQCIDQGLTGHKVLGAKESETPTSVGEAGGDGVPVAVRANDIGPVKSRCRDEDLEKQRVLVS
jgi:hypothetical protein